MGYTEKNITNQRRAEIALEIFNSDISIEKSCKLYGISYGTWYYWKNRFVKNGKDLKRPLGQKGECLKYLLYDNKDDR